MVLIFHFGQYLVFPPIDLKLKMAALKYHIFKPQNLHDWGSESAIDPINPLVYIQARHHEFKTGLGWNKNIQDVVLRGCPGFNLYLPIKPTRFLESLFVFSTIVIHSESPF
jgi:hypothetical protein